MFQPVVADIADKPMQRSELRSEICALDLMNNPEHGADGAIACTIANMTITLTIDSGSMFNTINEELWHRHHEELIAGGARLIASSKGERIQAYAYASSVPLTIVAHFSASITTAFLIRPRLEAEFIVVQGATRSLLSKDTARALNVLRMGNEVLAIQSEANKKFKKFPIAPYPQIELEIDESVEPSKQYYYRIPQAYESRVEARLAEMVAMDIIEKVDYIPRWLSGLSIVIKDADKFRLVLNMRRVNQAIKRPYVVIPTVDDIMGAVRGSRYFSKLDLTSAFFHMVLDERARDMTCFMTMTGVYRYKRLPFGMVSAPEIFQRFMTFVLKDIAGAQVYLDDILMHADTKQKLEAITKRVKERLARFNLTINEEKSEYMKTEITFLGHRLSKDGINIEEEKVKSIMSFRRPESKQELRSFLGLAGFVSHYIIGYSNLTEVLWKVIRGTGAFNWKPEQTIAFTKLKNEIARCTRTLGGFNPEAPVVLYTDASPWALSAVFTQPRQGNKSTIVSCASRTLTPTERRYDQTNKEMLAIVWSIEHFQFYLLGRHFTLRTDSAGAIASFQKEDASSTRCVMRRLNGYRSRLEMYDMSFDLISSKNNIADAASRLAEAGEVAEMPDRAPFEIATLDNYPVFPVTISNEAQYGYLEDMLTEQEIRELSRNDETTLRVAAALNSNEDWPTELVAYGRHKDELAFTNGILARAGRIVVPLPAREKALKIAHRGHPGMSGMKKLLRSSMWWPTMDTNVEDHVRACETCFLVVKQTNMTLMKRTPMPKRSWELLAMDHFGPIQAMNGVYVLAMVDYYSRYLFASVVPSTDFESTKQFLDGIFAERGLPEKLRSDNAPGFRQQLDQYCTQRGIQLQHSVPFAAHQNGAAESAMKIIGKILMVARKDREPFGRTLRLGVTAHNSIPHSKSGLIPAEAHFGARVRRNLPILKELQPNLDIEAARERDWRYKLKDKKRRDAIVHAKPTDIAPGDFVVCKKLHKTKAEPHYDDERHKVISVKNGDLIIISLNGTQKSRHVKDVKKVPPALLGENMLSDESDEDEEHQVESAPLQDEPMDTEPAPTDEPGIQQQEAAQPDPEQAQPATSSAIPIATQAAAAQPGPRKSTRVKKTTQREDFLYMLAKHLMAEHGNKMDLWKYKEQADKE